MAGTVISFVVGTVVLTLICGVESWHLRISFLRWKYRPTFLNLIPGIMGIAFITGGIVVSSLVGYALLWICVICGQLACSSLLDHLGLSAAQKIPLDAFRTAVLLVAMIGVALSVAGEMMQSTSPTGVGVGGSSSYWFVLLAAVVSVLIGAILPAQAALNRAAATVLPSKLAATWWSFFVAAVSGSMVLTAQLLTDAEGARRMIPAHAANAKWWYFVGGLLSVVYVSSTIFLLPLMGSAFFFLCLIVGQLVGSTLVDSVGAFGVPVRQIGPMRGVGIALVGLAAAAFQLRACPSTSDSKPKELSEHVPANFSAPVETISVTLNIDGSNSAML
jgi:transporter family-2 protein